MPKSDGTVTFSVWLDADDAEKELTKVKKKILDLQADLNQKNEAKDALVEDAIKAGEAYEQARNQLKALYAERDRLKGYSRNDPEYYPAQRRLPVLSQEIKQQEAVVKSLEAASARADAAIEKQDAAIQKTNADLERQIQKYGMVQKASMEAGEASMEAGERGETAAKTTTSALDNLGERLSGVFNRVVGLVKRINFFPELAKGIFSAVQNMNVFSQLTEAIGPKLQRVAGLAKRVFVFSVITAGLREIRKTISAWLTQNDALSASLASLKSAMATAFEPIFTAIIPAITSLLNMLTRAITAIAQFTAMLGGKTASQAKENAQALTEQAEATKSAGGAAKEAAKSLASFDEINQLSENHGGGGGGSSSAFDLAVDDKEIVSLGDAVSMALDGILEKVQNLPEILDSAAGKINAFFENLYDALSLSDIGAKITEIGTELSGALNLAVAKINWTMIGATFGAGINHMLTLFVATIGELNWTALGNALAGSINGIVANINWQNVGRLLWSGFKISFETLSGLLIGMNMSALAQAATSIILGFFDSLNETIKRIPWKQIGAQISKFLTGINWKKIGASVAGAMNAIVKAIDDFITSIDWKAIATDLAAGFNELVGDVDWHAVGQAICDGFKISVEFFSTILDQIDWNALGQALGDMLRGIDWSGIAHDCFELLGKAFGASILFLWGLIKDAWDRLINWWHDHAYEDGKFTMKGLLDGITWVIDGIVQWLDMNVFRPFIGAFCKLFGINSPSKVMEEQGKYIAEGMLNGIVEGLKNIPTWIKENIFSPIWNGLVSVFNITDNVANNFKAGGLAIANGLAAGIAEGSPTIKTALNGLIDVVEKAINWIVGKLNLLSIDIPPVFGAEGVHLGFNLSPISIPRLATGAVIPPNREFLAVLGDQSSGTNIEAPLETIVAAFRQAMRESGGGSRTVILEVDGQQFGRVVLDAYNTESRRVGVQLGGAT